LVTCIEVLSPTHKAGTGLEDYASKRLQILSSGAHLVEIDLLRAGVRFPTVDPLPRMPYFVFISHAERLSKVDVWPVALDAALPVIPIPLLLGDDPVSLDLQQALDVVYNIFAYDESIDYTNPPPGPLSAEQASLLHERLRAAGRR
jgi:hypothetical protein